MIPIAVQLYTVRDLLNVDVVGTLKRVRAAGYTLVELAGLGPYTPKELQRILADAGLTPVAKHTPIDRLEGDINAVIESAGELGVKHVVCPWLPDERRGSEAAWKACAASLNRAGQATLAHGIQLSYHNHSFEFVHVGRGYAFDLLFAEMDPKYVKSELDTYWVRHGGEDPVAYINRLSGRVPLLHLKDMARDEKRSFAEVGTGLLDFPTIFRAAQAAGTEYGIVEQDTCPGDPIDSITTSLRNLKNMGLA